MPELIFPLFSDEEKSLKYRHLVVKIEQSNSVTTIEAEESLKKVLKTTKLITIFSLCKLAQLVVAHHILKSIG